MGKRIYIIYFLIVIITVVTSSIIILKKKEKKEIEYFSAEKVTDECTEEYENAKEIVTNSRDEKLSPNSKFVLRKLYKECNHTINEEAELPKELVNLSEKEIQDQYPNWKVIGFNENEVILYKEMNGICNQHFKIIIKDGKVNVYRLNNDKKEELYKITDISTEYLPETDIINLENGINVYGLDELNRYLEDLE